MTRKPQVSERASWRGRGVVASGGYGDLVAQLLQAAEQRGDAALADEHAPVAGGEALPPDGVGEHAAHLGQARAGDVVVAVQPGAGDGRLVVLVAPALTTRQAEELRDGGWIGEGRFFELEGVVVEVDALPARLGVRPRCGGQRQEPQQL